MVSIFSRPITELISLRYSVRNYEDKPLDEDIINKIESYISNLDNPFGGKVRVKLIKKDEYNKDVKLGTYGFIRGAKYYLTVACENGEFALESLGYAFEKVVLYCTSLGLGTVWMGGTFNKGAFAKTMNLKENETLAIVSPVGYEGGKKSIIGSIIGSKKKPRKAFSDIFFNNDFNTPLLKELAGEYGEPLEMVRLAPSAMNKQSWRIVKKDNTIHFYSNGNMEMNKIDLGIAMCHFDLTVKENGINGEFKFTDPKIDTKYKYVISWIRQ